MKLIYVAGPYRAATVNGIHENIQTARALACEVWRMGAAALCPHMNSAMMDGVVSDEVFLSGGLDMLIRCDAILVAPDYLSSKGTCEEIILALRLQIPIFHSLEGLRAYLKESESAPNGPAATSPVSTPNHVVPDDPVTHRQARQFFSYETAYQREEDASDRESAESQVVNPAKEECELPDFQSDRAHP